MQSCQDPQSSPKSNIQNSYAKWSGVLEWAKSVPGTTSHSVWAQLSIAESLPPHYVKWFRELWPKKLQLQLTQQTAANVLCHLEGCFTAEVILKPCPDLVLLILELSNKKVGLAFFTDIESHAGWGLLLANSEEKKLKAIIFVWNLELPNQCQQFIKCLTALESKQIRVDWSNLSRREDSSANQNNLQEAIKDMFQQNPGPRGSRNEPYSVYFSSLNNHGRNKPPPKNFTQNQGFFVGRANQLPGNNTYKVTNQSFQESNRELQNHRGNFSTNSSYQPNNKHSRWSSPARRSKSRSPSDQSWKSARQSQEQKKPIQNHKQSNTPARPKERPSQPSNAVGLQTSTPNHPSSNTQNVTNSGGNAFIKNRSNNQSQNNQDHRDKPKHVTEIIQAEQSLASTSTQAKPANTPQKSKAQEKKQEATPPFKISLSEKKEQNQISFSHVQAPPSQNCTLQSSQDKTKCLSLTTINLDTQLRNPSIFDPLPCTSQEKCGNDPLSPISNTSAYQPTVNGQTDQSGEQKMSPEVTEYLLPLHDLLKCCRCKRWLGTMQVNSCICSLACIECTNAEPNCPQCHEPMIEDIKLSWLHHRISSVIHHPCPHENCAEIVSPGDAHEAGCVHKPHECIICGLQFPKSTAWTHFQNQHPRQIPLQEGSNANVKSIQFWPNKETSNLMICCYLQEQFLTITLQKFDDQQKNAEFIMEKQHSDSDINFVVKFTFERNDWSFSRQNASRGRGSSLTYVEVPLHIINTWLDGESTMDIMITTKNKRKIIQKTNSPRKRYNKKRKEGDSNVK